MTGNIGSLELSDIVNADELQSLLNELYKFTGVLMALVDVKGYVLVSVGWQEICSRFHRAHPIASHYCTESDTILTKDISEGEYKKYKCKNSIWKVATPIVIKNKHFGNFFIGQFFFEDEDIDYSFFRERAKKFGFDETEYLDALNKVPCLKSERVTEIMNLCTKMMASFIDITNSKKAEEELKQSESRLQSLVDLFHYETDTIQELHDFALNEAMNLTKSNVGHYYHYDEKKSEFTLISFSDDVMEECKIAKEKPNRKLSEAGIWAETVRQRKPIIINDYDAYNPLKRGQPKGHAKIKRYLGVPIFREGEIIAVIGVANKENNYTKSDELQLNLFIDNVWEVIERKRLEEELQKSEEKLRFSEQRFRNFVEKASDFIFTVNAKGEFTYVSPNSKVTTGYAPEELIGKSSDIILHPDEIEKRDKVIRKLFSFGNIDGENEYNFIDKDGEYRWLAVKSNVIKDNYNQRAILSVGRDVTDRKQAEQKLKRYASKLEETKRKLDKEIDTAKQMHERTLPVEFPNITGVSMASHHQPARYLGGDFYNVIKEGNKLIFYISDVTGHGIEGALISQFVKEAIDSYISLKPEEIFPDKLVNHLNRQFRKENYPQDYFISLFLGVIDLDSYILHYTGAGFQESVLVSIDNHRQIRLFGESPPISATISSKLMDFKTRKVKLSPGSTLLLNTDGLTEQTRVRQMFGRKKDTIFHENKNLPPEVIIQSINEEFWRFNGGSLQGHDDITLLVIQIEKTTKKEYNWKFNTAVKELNRLEEEVYPILQQMVQEEVFYQGIYELLVNAVEHGNRFAPEKKVYLSITFTEDYVLVTVEDEGEGFQWREHKNLLRRIDCKTERGRGIMITEMLSDVVLFNKKGNKAYLILKNKEK